MNSPGELAALRERVAVLEAEKRTKHHRVRSVCSVLLIVLGCVLAPLGTVAVWAAHIVGDTDQYVTTVAPLADDPDVQKAASERVANAVLEHVDTAALLQQVAPEDRPALERALGRLEGPLDDALHSLVRSTAQQVVASDAFAKVWTEANREAHASIDKALTGQGGGLVELSDNAATLDLAPLVERVKERLVAAGLTFAERIPPVHTEFTLVQSEDIGKVKRGFRLLQLAGNWLPVIALVLLAAGVLTAVGRRRALIAAALGTVLGMLLLGLALTLARPLYLDALPAGVSRPAAGSVFDILVRFLRRGVRMVAVLGIVVALGAWLTGGGRWARSVRGVWRSGIGAAAGHAGLRTGPVGPWVHRWRRWLTWAAVAAGAVAVVLWPAPTAMVVVGLALAVLAVLAVIEFLDPEGHPNGVTPVAGEAPRPDA
ncbi:hypothetical protein SRB5_45640 [Streptomyces sp. RB5]|uniref:Integral membrane protein n=1 Tax=Streptomyces smaragdinus TaxID=2585196 RepID=A0A7K0CLN0_9ACTN|nr:hypothetical protein [Streptomyces smaragdinus]MQY14398.1 hypothetical protein [Streptomyces smaragdinus]